MSSILRFSALAVLTAALAGAAPAQQSITADDGSTITALKSAGGPGAQVPGSLTTLFASDNQFAGNMVDITPAADLTITGIDVNVSEVGGTATVEVWYRDGTSFGNETNPLLDWVLLGTFSSAAGATAGTDAPTFIDMSGNGMTFLSGKVYGFYVNLTSYLGGVQALRYTNGGPNNYTNADLDILTNAGKGSPGFGGSTFVPRQWNGTIYYDSGPCSPTLTITNLIAGQTATAAVSCATPGGPVYLAYSLAGGGPSNVNAGPCGMISVALSQPYKAFPPIPADPAGNISILNPVPSGTTGVTVWAQAFDAASCTLTNGFMGTIG